MFVSEIFDECAEILGTTDQTKVFRKITQAVQTLMESGHWTHATAEVDVCTGWDKCSLALPRGIDIPLAVNIDGSPTYFRNRLFQYHVNKGGMYNSVEWAWDDRGYVATLMDITRPSQLVAVAESNNDVGKTIRVLGIDQNNRNIRSQMPTGAGVDGLLVSIHSQQDFQYGTIAPDGNTIATREVTIDPITDFTTTTPHSLSSGQAMSARIISGTIPVPLNDGQTYYVGVIDAYTVQLFSDSLNAQVLQYPIALQSIDGFVSMQLQDKRTAQVETSLKFVPPSPTFTIDSPNEIVFPPQSLPAPLQAQRTYFAQPVDADHIQVFQTLSDATSNTNPVYLTGSNNAIDVDIRKAITPETKLVFPVKHYFRDGDQVQAYTGGGVLPQPLVYNQNYFVNIVDAYSVSLHSNQTDAIDSTPTNFVNPIQITTSGSGTNSLVKLIQATSRTGTQSQITTGSSGLSIDPASGSGASFQAITVGGVTNVVVTAGGTAYASAPSVTFSEPQDPPAGSNIQVRAATGYALLAGTAVTAIVLTDSGFGYTSAPVITFNSGAAAATATITKSFISGFIKISGGFDYQEVPQVQITGGNGSGATVTASVNNSNLSVSSINRVGSTATATTVSPHGFVINQTVRISGGVGSSTGFNGDVVIEVPTIDTNISSLTKATATATLATVTTATNHDYNTGDRVTFSGFTGTSNVYNTSFNATVTSPTTFTIIVPSTTPTPGVGTAISKIPDSDALTFTYSVLATLPASASGTITVFSGEVTGLNLITSGSGYTSTPTVSFIPSTGIFVDFSSTGILPFPLVSGTIYRAESPLNAVSGTFTVKNTDFSDVNITSSGTGTFYLVLSRSFSVDFTNNWLGDFASLITGQQIYFGTDYLFPTTSPSIDNGITPRYLRYISNTLGQVYDTFANATNPPLTTGLINIDSFGTGQTYYALRTQVTPSVDTNLISANNLSFLTENQVVQFSSSGTLPSPLVVFTDYTISLIGNSIRVYNGSTPIVLINGGIGQLSLDIIRDVQVQPSNNIVATASLYETGTELVARAKLGDVLPNGLVEGTNYYVRRINNNSFELYDTLNNSRTLNSITGRKTYTTSGNKVTSKFFTDAIFEAVLVKSIAHIEKPLTDGYVSLYAWDYGRSNDMTLIGQYHPTEVNPQYRKIRLGKQCAWARILYKVTSPKVSSIYDFIPLEQERAIIAAVHAVDLEDKDFADQAVRYWGIAYQYLKNQQESIDGHAMTPPQINNITYGDGTDVVMW